MGKKRFIPAAVLFLFLAPGNIWAQSNLAGNFSANTAEKKAAITQQSTEWEQKKLFLHGRSQSLPPIVQEAQRKVNALTDRVAMLRKQWVKQQAMIERVMSEVRKAHLTFLRTERMMERSNNTASRKLASAALTTLSIPEQLLNLLRLRQQQADEKALGSAINMQMRDARRQERLERKKLRALEQEEQATSSQLRQAGQRLSALARRLASLDTPRGHASAPREQPSPVPQRQGATGTSTEAPVSPMTFQDLSKRQQRVNDFIANSPSAIAQEKFAWPIAPTAGLSAYFHDASYIEKIGQDHFAIDIIADQGTEIVAPADGLALVAEDSGTGFQYVILLHKNGYLTMYGHISKFNIEAGDFVRTGSVIGWSGGAVGMHGSGRKTTGPHLHFEVWRDNRRLDPLLFLDVDELPNDPNKVDRSHIPAPQERRSIAR